MAEQKSIVFACIVNHTLGGRVFVEAGAKGDLDRPITGFISGVVNKRAEPKGDSCLGTHSMFQVLLIREAIVSATWRELTALIPLLLLHRPT